MLAKILAGVVVAFGVTGLGLYFANSKSTGNTGGPRQAASFSISVPAVDEPDCCFAGSPCCRGDDCCLKKEQATKVKITCCEDGNCAEATSTTK